MMENVAKLIFSRDRIAALSAARARVVERGEPGGRAGGRAVVHPRVRAPSFIRLLSVGLHRIGAFLSFRAATRGRR